MIRSIADLEGLPDGAVVEDHNNKIWQHGIGGLSPEDVERAIYTSRWNTKQLWVTFASLQVEYTTGIALPARLLDDGL